MSSAVSIFVRDILSCYSSKAFTTSVLIIGMVINPPSIITILLDNHSTTITYNGYPIVLSLLWGSSLLHIPVVLFLLGACDWLSNTLTLIGWKRTASGTIFVDIGVWHTFNRSHVLSFYNTFFDSIVMYHCN